jgi:hypothetical protein
MRLVLCGVVYDATKVDADIGITQFAARSRRTEIRDGGLVGFENSALRLLEEVGCGHAIGMLTC